MYFRQIAAATALYAMLLAMFALGGATARMPTFDVGIHDRYQESSSAYGLEPEVFILVEEDIVP